MSLAFGTGGEDGKPKKVTISFHDTSFPMGVHPEGQRDIALAENESTAPSSGAEELPITEEHMRLAEEEWDGRWKEQARRNIFTISEITTAGESATTGPQSGNERGDHYR